LTKDLSLVFRKVFEIIAIECVFSANQGILHSDSEEKSKLDRLSASVGKFREKIISNHPRFFLAEKKDFPG
jgi:hypothetical protein